MELRTFGRVVRRGWAVILLLVVLGAGAGVALTLLTPTTYQSTAKIFVASSNLDSNSLQGGNSFTQDRTAAYTIFARSPEVTSKVAEELRLSTSPSALGRQINATVEDNKVVIDIAVTDKSPQTAAAIANTTSKYFIDEVIANEQRVSNGNGGTTSVVKLNVVYPATAPAGPVSPKPVLNIGLGVVAGLLLGLGLVVLRDVLDNTMKSPGDFEALGVPVLGMVPFDKRAARTPVAFRGDPHSARSEAYRALRTNMQFVDVDNPPHLIAITSAMPGEGKTTTSVNLASALAEAGYRVCLIDADLRRPSVANTLGLVGEVGFTSVLISDIPVEDVLQNAGRNLAVLTSGPVPPNPSELLITDHAQSVIKEIAAKVDYCVIDTPPLLPVTDGAELATIADATLVVARARKTTMDQSKRAIEALAKVGEKPVGVILNMISSGSASDAQYGYYYAPYRPDRSKRSTTEATPATTPAATTGDDAETAEESPTTAASGSRHEPAL